MPEDEILHVRVALSRKSREVAENLAQSLREMGFENVSSGARGVDFESHKSNIEEKLMASIVKNEKGNLFSTQPSFPIDIRDHIRSAYFPNKLEYFHRKGEKND